MSWYEGYVKYINANLSDGLMKIGMSTNPDPSEEEPSIWFNIWASTNETSYRAYSDLGKQMILNLRYAYVYGVKVTVSYSSYNDSFILDSVSASWRAEADS